MTTHLSVFAEYRGYLFSLAQRILGSRADAEDLLQETLDEEGAADHKLTEIAEGIVNDELPILYIHHLTALQAGAMNLQGYQPAISGPFSTRGGGIRTAWLA